MFSFSILSKLFLNCLYELPENSDIAIYPIFLSFFSNTLLVTYGISTLLKLIVISISLLSLSTVNTTLSFPLFLT